MIKKLLIIVIASLLFLSGTKVINAATGENASVDVGSTGRISDGPTTPGQLVAQAGNVTHVNISRNYSTSKWAGFFGNVSASVKMGVNSDVFFDFGSSVILAVYASQNQSFNWANINKTDTDAIDTAFGFNTAADPDQAVDVYSSTKTIDGTINTPSATLEDGNFDTYAVCQITNTTVGDFAFGGEVQNAGALGFDSNSWQYELLVPINAGTPTYYFFLTI